MEKRMVRITVSTLDGEVLDLKVVEIPRGHRYIAIKPVTYSMAKTPSEQVLDLGEKNP